MPVVIELEQITKRYGLTQALSDVSFTCESGITGLLGPNGAGKSTLIKILMGLLRPTSGRGTVLQHALGREGRAIRSLVGYMPEEDCYIAGLTGIEMVCFSANLAGLPHVEGLRRAHEILDFCGMGQERYRTVDTYSTGMRQKAKFAAAIVHDPRLLILDEPTSGLDPEERQALLSRLHVLSREHGKAILLSTHILPDVQNVCDHVIIIAQGQLQVADRLENLNRTATPAVHLRVLQDVTQSIQELQGAGFQVQHERGNHLVISGDPPGLANLIWQCCSNKGIQIQSLTPGKTSLEEVFLQAVSETQMADNPIDANPKGASHAHS